MVWHCDIYLFLFRAKKSTPLIESYRCHLDWILLVRMDLFTYILTVGLITSGLTQCTYLCKDTFLGVFIRHIIIIHFQIFLVNHNPQIHQKKQSKSKRFWKSIFPFSFLCCQIKLPIIYVDSWWIGYFGKYFCEDCNLSGEQRLIDSKGGYYQTGNQNLLTPTMLRLSRNSHSYQNLICHITYLENKNTLKKVILSETCFLWLVCNV